MFCDAAFEIYLCGWMDKLISGVKQKQKMSDDKMMILLSKKQS